MDFMTRVLNSKELAKAQMEIDRCNHKDGCDSCCSKQAQRQCMKLKVHSFIMSELRKS